MSSDHADAAARKAPVPTPADNTDTYSSYVEDFRRAAHEAVDWVAEYLANTRRYPVLPQVKPGELIESLPGSAPDKGQSFETIFQDFNNLVMPAVTHWNHPRFMAYFGCSGATPTIIAEMLAAALDTNGLHWLTSPALAELENVTLGWYRQWLGLPEEFFGIIYDSGSTSTMHAIAAAREMADPQARENGATGNLTLYASAEAHSSIEKGAIAVGIGRKNVRKIPADAEFRMKPDALVEAIERDLAAGKKPFCVVATVGTTSSTSVDPVAKIADVAEKYNLWVHVDAAYAGAAAMLPEHRHIFDGVERAHSMVTNPHKWLFTPVDLSAFYTRRPDILRRAFSLIPEYLRPAQDPRAINLMDYGIPLGRRFRALKFWYLLRYFGRDAIQQILRNHIAWARELADQIGAQPRFERVAPVPFSVVCFRYKGTDEQNKLLLERLNATGEAFLSHTSLSGQYVLRVAIGNLATTRDDVQRVWQLLQKIAAEL